MKKTITLVLISLLSINAFSQELYDINTIQTIEIEFAESNWDALLDAEKAGDNNYTEATSVTINGTVYSQVGVKYKGNSSYSANSNKKSISYRIRYLCRSRPSRLYGYKVSKCDV